MPTPHHAAPQLTQPSAALVCEPSAWRRVLAGKAGPRADGVMRLLYMAPSYGAMIALLSVAVLVDLGELAPLRETLWLFAYGCSGILAFYVYLRLGLAEKRRDPLLVFPQLCFNVSIVVLAYTLVPLTRGLVVQWLCLLILFDMRRLTGRQVLLIAAIAYGLLMEAMFLVWRTAPEHIDIAAEAVNIVMAGITLCALLAVTRVARRVHEQRSAQQAKLADTVAKLDELAMRDSLTGVFNRRYMQTMLEQELRRQVRRHYTLCVALLDIDHFKQVNDRYGHAVGDAVLRDVAQLLSTALSAPFAVGRWGGEEFLVLFPECTLVDAQAALRRASQAVRAHDWAQHDPALQVSFSGGVCQHRPAQSAAAQLPDALRDDLGDLLERVDRALYAAKANGRNRIEAA